ncbi:DUF362 domain-containing protein [Candidatus Bathyarchaeota archaeon]|nr:DUF362 domain-containing protein [Candidatus Bathyarchaeota archaeon]
MSEVQFRRWNPKENMVEAFEEFLKKSDSLTVINKGDLVAIKLHPGELGTPYYIKPIYVRKLVEKIREAGGKPFLTDTTTLYTGKRHDALDLLQTVDAHGLGLGSVGAPFVVADGVKGGEGVQVKTSGIVKTVGVAPIFGEVDSMVVLIHVKGHGLAGIGGAIKQLGMGCVDKKTKLAAHRTVDLKVDHDKCTGCGTCLKICRDKIPRIENGKAYMDSPLCMRCPYCQSACPTQAISLINRENLQKALAATTQGVLKVVRRDKICFIGFAIDITRLCDCTPAPGPRIRDDVGILASFDPVAIDNAAIDLISEPLIMQHNGVSPRIQVKEAQRLGIGKTDYSLTEL